MSSNLRQGSEPSASASASASAFNNSPSKLQPSTVDPFEPKDEPKIASSRKKPIPIPDRGHGNTTLQGRMDPFEVRIRFTSHLQHLNATVTSANKAAQYALKYRDMDEDLHSCILEQIEKNSMNNRANIMYFVEHLCDMAAREDHFDYIRMMQRDILRIVDAAAPEDGSGAANVKVVRKVLQALQQKSFLLAQTVQEIEELLKERDTLPDAVGLSSPLGPGMPEDVHMSGTTPLATSQTKAKTNSVMGVRLDKKQIEQRIEEDRERHKRQRENVWAIPKPASGGTQAISDAEFEDMWENTSELGEDDFDLYAEEAEERRKAAREWKEEFFATFE